MGNGYIQQSEFSKIHYRSLPDSTYSNGASYITYHMGEPESEQVLDLLADDYAREILAYLSKQPMLVEDLGENCDGSKSTIYDRVDQLESVGLVSVDLQIDPRGHHRKRYETILDTVLVTFDDGRYEVHLEFREDAPDRFARMWGDLRGE